MCGFFRFRAALTRGLFCLEKVMKFSHLNEEAKQQARAALCAVVSSTSWRTDSPQVVGQTVAAAFIALEQYDSNPEAQPVIIGVDDKINISITTKP